MAQLELAWDRSSQPLCPPHSVNLSKTNCLITLRKKYADFKYQALPTSSPSPWLSLSSFMPLPSSLYLLPLKSLLDCWNAHLDLGSFFVVLCPATETKVFPWWKVWLSCCTEDPGWLLLMNLLLALSPVSLISFSDFFFCASLFSFIDAQSLCWMTSLVALVMFWT